MKATMVKEPYRLGNRTQTTSCRGARVIPSPYYERSSVLQFLHDREIPAAENLTVIEANALPKKLLSGLSQAQCDGLAFAYKEFVIASDPKIQTFQIGSSTKGTGTTTQIGLGHTLSQNWGMYGGLGTINLSQLTTNTFRTDIQLRLEDARTKEKLFFERSIPLPLTVSMDRSDTIKLYYMRGGLLIPNENDFRMDTWTPFLVENLHTDQLIPLASIPSLAKENLIAFQLLVGISFLFAVIGLLAQSISVGIVFVLVGVFFIYVIVGRDKKWKADVALAKAARNNDVTTKL